MAGINVADSTAYSPKTSTQSNVPYQLKVWYYIKARSSTSVTFTFDVEVFYPDSWSSNGAWVRADGITRSCNPSHRDGSYDWYASTQNTSRSSNSYWQDMSINVDGSATTATFKVGFSNTQHGEGTYHDQTFTIDFPQGWTNVGKPGTPSVNATWAESSITWNWSAAPSGTGNAPDNYYINLQRLDPGGSWYDLTNAWIGKTTSYTRTISSDTRGSGYRLRVKASGTYGPDSAYSNYSGTSYRNYAPEVPVISKIGSSTAAAGMNVHIDHSVTTSASGDAGGFSSGKSYVDRAVYVNGAHTNWQNNTTIFYPVWEAFAGMQGVEVKARATDGLYTTAYCTPVYVDVGQSISASAPTSNTTSLNSSTALTIDAAVLDGQYIPVVNQSVSLQYNTSANSTWKTLKTITISANSTSNVTISNIMQLLHDNDDTILSGSKTFYFKAVYTIGHLTNYSTSSKSLTYSEPSVIATLTHADGSTDLRFPMDKTIPVTEDSASLSVQILAWTAGDSGKLRIEAKDVSQSSWKTIKSASFSGPSTHNFIYYLHTDPTLQVDPGETIELRAVVEIVANPNIIVFSGPINWSTADNINPQDLNRIENRPYPSILIQPWTMNEQLNFIRNDVANGIQIPYQLYWEIERAYCLVDHQLEIGSHIVDDSVINRLLFSNLEEPIVFSGSSVEVADTINNTEPLTWTLISATVSDADIVLAAGMNINGNSNIPVKRTIVVKEAYRSSIGQPPSTSLLSAKSSTIHYTTTANTYCIPSFGDGEIEYDRTLT